MNKLLLVVMGLFVEVASTALAVEPEIWFAPEDNVRQAARNVPWKSDFLELFPENAPWPKAAARVQIFQIYPQFVAQASDQDLRTVIEGLKRRGIGLALSTGMIHRPPGGAHHEGLGAETAARDAARIKRLGGQLCCVVADEPVYFSHFYHAPGVISVPIAQAARDMAGTAQVFRQVFPHIRIGLDDPPMHYESMSQWTSAMREFLDEYRRAMGEPLSFVRVENANHEPREWLPRFTAVAQFLQQEGVAMGILITGDTDDTCDADWTRKAEERYVVYESEGRAAPAQMVFQSWMPRPSRLLPEDMKDTHTYCLNGYFRDRTELTVSRQKNQFRGRLTDSSNRPLENVPVSISVLPGFADPAMTHRVFQGKVPAGASDMRMGIRIGAEGSVPGKSQLCLESAQYGESGKADVPIPLGLKGWGKTGAAQVEEIAPHGLNISATVKQSLILNSPSLPVTAGVDFTLTLQLHIKPSTETGYLVMFFFDANKKVLQRLKEPLLVNKLKFVKALTTDADGRLECAAQLPDLEQAREIRFWYPGDERRRPAIARVECNHQ